MARYFTAQCDDLGLCLAVVETPSPVSPPEGSGQIFVPLESYDTSVIGKVWDGEGWTDPA